MTDSKKPEPKVEREVAEQFFRDWALEMDIDLDEKLDAEDAAQLKKQSNRIIKAIMAGDAVINAEGLMTYTPSHRNSKYKQTIVFQERTGAHLMAMDGQGKDRDARKTFAVMAEMCGVSPATFAGNNLVGKDAKICEAIFALLMD